MGYFSRTASAKTSTTSWITRIHPIPIPEYQFIDVVSKGPLRACLRKFRLLSWPHRKVSGVRKRGDLRKPPEIFNPQSTIFLPFSEFVSIFEEIVKTRQKGRNRGHISEPHWRGPATECAWFTSWFFNLDSSCALSIAKRRFASGIPHF